MSYLVLARKWRPKNLDELVGQETISRILKNAIQQDRVAHAYLFSGPRGVGKTSTARILAKSLNCVDGPTVSPCEVCPSCKAITEGHSVDVMEIDGASNNSVDDIRTLREGVKYAPSSGRFKIYIIDEVHMLSQSAFNALLKTLEEPPSHVIFILATTTPHKVPVTVLSRCQHLPFRRISPESMRVQLKRIVQAEGIEITDEALDMIIKASDGGMRDALTLLDQIHSFTDRITEQDIRDILGLSDVDLVVELSRAIIRSDRKKVFEIVQSLYNRGTDFKTFMQDLLALFRELLVAKVTGRIQGNISANETAFIQEVSPSVTEEEIALLLSELIRTDADIRSSFSPRVALEMGLIRATLLEDLRPVGEIIERLKNLPVNELPVAFSTSDKTNNENHIPAPEEERENLSEMKETQAVMDEPPVHPLDAEQLWAEAVSCIEETNPVLASKLIHAQPRVEDEKLILQFNGGHRVFAESLKKDTQKLYSLLMEATPFKQSRISSIEIVSNKGKRQIKKKESLKEIELTPEELKIIEAFGARIIERRKTDV
ncbi:MAG: DNA polymerase III subunit gamma/tau [Nitrospirae bacterium]|nr:DNA polymerase III subunit gamma/tau [Nitrospirota bacterium]